MRVFKKTVLFIQLLATVDLFSMCCADTDIALEDGGAGGIEQAGNVHGTETNGQIRKPLGPGVNVPGTGQNGNSIGTGQTGTPVGTGQGQTGTPIGTGQGQGGNPIGAQGGTPAGTGQGQVGNPIGNGQGQGGNPIGGQGGTPAGTGQGQVANPAGNGQTVNVPGAQGGTGQTGSTPVDMNTCGPYNSVPGKGSNPIIMGQCLARNEACQASQAGQVCCSGRCQLISQGCICLASRKNERCIRTGDCGGACKPKYVNNQKGCEPLCSEMVCTCKSKVPPQGQGADPCNV